jgi:enoyl-[acyl-carrier protein] reductase II
MKSLNAMLGTRYPIIQAGMVWCSGWELAAASSNAGILGVLGSGSMYPDVLKHHIQKTKDHTNGPFAVNLPLLYPQIEDHINVILEAGVKKVITSAGNPAKWTSELKKHDIQVWHVVSSARFAVKAAESGVDGVICEGFEAGGHNGREETTTMCLIPEVRKSVSLPLVAAGGIASGSSILAAMTLGADGVQIGTRFAASEESSAHINFKRAIVEAAEGSTRLTLKELAPVRLIKNDFYLKIEEAYTKGASKDELKHLLGRGRAKKGMFEGDLKEGELEIGQISSQVHDILPVADIVKQIISEYNSRLIEIAGLNPLPL